MINCFRSITGVGILLLAFMAQADQYTWTKTSSVLNDAFVYGDTYGVVNISDNPQTITWEPSGTHRMFVTAHYDVTGAVNASPAWTTPFAALTATTAILHADLDSFTVPAHKGYTYKVRYTAELGSEVWTGTCTSDGVTITSTATRDKYYCKTAATIDLTISDAPGGGE